jgi:hypothetical protein
LGNNGGMEPLVELDLGDLRLRAGVSSRRAGGARGRSCAAELVALGVLHHHS